MKRELKVSDGVPESALKELKLGYINLADGFFDLAQTNFDLVILSDPKCADAFWGLMLCKCHIRNEDVLLTNATLYKNIVFYHIFIKIFKDLIKIFLKKMFCLKYQFQNINIFLFAFHY